MEDPSLVWHVTCIEGLSLRTLCGRNRKSLCSSAPDSSNCICCYCNSDVNCLNLYLSQHSFGWQSSGGSCLHAAAHLHTCLCLPRLCWMPAECTRFCLHLKRFLEDISKCAQALHQHVTPANAALSGACCLFVAAPVCPALCKQARSPEQSLVAGYKQHGETGSFSDTSA